MPLELTVLPPGVADVSVITPAFNAQASIARTLASIAAQTLHPREVIIVDDGSTDGTVAAAEGFAPEMRGIALKILHQDNRGAAAARNRAIQVAAGHWLAFLDADDEWRPAKIERCMAELARHGADMAVHDYIRVESGTELFIDCARHCPPGIDPFVAQLLYGFISSTSVVVRHELVRRVGGFDAALRSSHDYELWLALLVESGTRFCMIPEALSRYHITPDGISSNATLRRAASLTALARHWRALKNRAAFPPLVAAARATIVHMQAAGMNMDAGRLGAAVLDILSAPVSLIRLFADLPPDRRPDSLARP